mmetsp:Transcript_52956/g.124025  ORF Transcript_52956/g.124025 Transcript_52956/m.124025 type:complete len:528 (-) Transcript_52956:49-1632(-)
MYSYAQASPPPNVQRPVARSVCRVAGAPSPLGTTEFPPSGQVRYVQPAPAVPKTSMGGFPMEVQVLGAQPGFDMLGGAIVVAPTMPASAPLNMDDLPFSSMGHKAMWQGIFDQVQKEVDAYLESQKGQQGNPTSFRMPRLPLPNIHERQIEMIFDSYDMEGDGHLDVEKLKALMQDMQCVNCLAMSQHKGEALAEARAEMTAMMGAQVASVMSGFMSQAMDFELQMVKALSCEEVPEEDAKELLKELDADRDGKVSKADFKKTAKKALFDPNPPEEVLEAMEAAEAMMMMAGGPLALGAPPGAMMMVDGQPFGPCGHAPTLPMPTAGNVRVVADATGARDRGDRPRVVRRSSPPPARRIAADHYGHNSSVKPLHGIGQPVTWQTSGQDAHPSASVRMAAPPQAQVRGLQKPVTATLPQGASVYRASANAVTAPKPVLPQATSRPGCQQAASPAMAYATLRPGSGPSMHPAVDTVRSPSLPSGHQHGFINPGASFSGYPVRTTQGAMSGPTPVSNLGAVSYPQVLVRR